MSSYKKICSYLRGMVAKAPSQTSHRALPIWLSSCVRLSRPSRCSSHTVPIYSWHGMTWSRCSGIVYHRNTTKGNTSTKAVEHRKRHSPAAPCRLLPWKGLPVEHLYLLRRWAEKRKYAKVYFSVIDVYIIRNCQNKQYRWLSVVEPNLTAKNKYISDLAI